MTDRDTFNVNHYVHIRLTDLGRNHLQKIRRTPPPDDADGYSRWQLHDVMNTFGGLLVGFPVPFEPIIILERAGDD